MGLEVQSQHLASAVRIAFADGVNDRLGWPMWMELEYTCVKLRGDGEDIGPWQMSPVLVACRNPGTASVWASDIVLDRWDQTSRPWNGKWLWNCSKCCRAKEWLMPLSI